MITLPHSASAPCCISLTAIILNKRVEDGNMGSKNSENATSLLDNKLVCAALLTFAVLVHTNLFQVTHSEKIWLDVKENLSLLFNELN